MPPPAPATAAPLRWHLQRPTTLVCLQPPQRPRQALSALCMAPSLPPTSRGPYPCSSSSHAWWWPRWPLPASWHAPSPAAAATASLWHVTWHAAPLRKTLRADNPPHKRGPPSPCTQRAWKWRRPQLLLRLVLQPLLLLCRVRLRTLNILMAPRSTAAAAGRRRRYRYPPVTRMPRPTHRQTCRPCCWRWRQGRRPAALTTRCQPAAAQVAGAVTLASPCPRTAAIAASEPAGRFTAVCNVAMAAAARNVATWTRPHIQAPKRQDGVRLRIFPRCVQPAGQAAFHAAIITALPRPCVVHSVIASGRR